MKTLVIACPMFTAEFKYGRAHLMQNGPQLRMNAVDKFRPKLDGNGCLGIANGQQAAAGACTSLDDQYFTPRAAQLASGRKARCARPDDDYSLRRNFHSLSF